MSTRDRLLLAVVGSVIMIAAGWFLIVSPRQDQASQLATQVSTAQSQLATAQASVAAAHSAQNQYPSEYSTVAKLGEAIPADDDMPSLLVQLQSAAQGSRVDFAGLTLGGSTSSAAAASASTPGAAALPPGATVGTAGLPTLPFSFTFHGSFFDLTSLFGRIQNFVTAGNSSLQVSGRLLTVNSINLTPGTQGYPQVNATVSATAYLVPSSEGATGGATPAGPAATTTTATPAATTTPTATTAPAAVTAPVR